MRNWRKFRRSRETGDRSQSGRRRRLQRQARTPRDCGIAGSVRADIARLSPGQRGTPGDVSPFQSLGRSAPVRLAMLPETLRRRRDPVAPGRRLPSAPPSRRHCVAATRSGDFRERLFRISAGSHRGRVLEHALHANHLVTEPVGVDRAVSCPLSLGDVSIHNCLTVHRAGTNRTAKPRRAFAVVCQVVPEIHATAASTRSNE